jgi:hypothetical protein
MKEKNMFKKTKYFVSAVFSTDAKFPLPKISFYVLKNIFRSREKNITPPLKVKRIAV